MNFAITWLFDKLGYMPKIDMEIGKVKIDTQSPEFKMWPFPAPEEKKKPVKKTRPLPSRATKTKQAVAKKIVKKAEKIVKKKAK
jgi:hypothetical protein